jgi:hypothetical protein
LHNTKRELIEDELFLMLILWIYGLKYYGHFEMIKSIKDDDGSFSEIKSKADFI